MILLTQNIEDYNNDLRVSLQAFYGGERIVVPEIFDKSSWQIKSKSWKKNTGKRFRDTGVVIVR